MTALENYTFTVSKKCLDDPSIKRQLYCIANGSQIDSFLRLTLGGKLVTKYWPYKSRANFVVKLLKPKSVGKS